MEFDIRQLDRVDPESSGADEAFDDFQHALIDRFLDSPEGEGLLDADSGAGFWSAQLLDYGYRYLGVTVARMSAADVREVVTELFPRKISLEEPEDADDAIPELTAFWEYLGREFKLRRAGAVIKFLRKVAPRFRDMMFDPANFGMAKSIVMQGMAAGFDMDTEQGMNAFMMAYNASLLAGAAPPRPAVRAPHFLDEPRRSGPDREKAKKKRKQARAARKRNRKRRK